MSECCTSHQAAVRKRAVNPRLIKSWGLSSDPGGSTITFLATAVIAVASTSSICTTPRRK
jgi:hypothetical protein